MKPGTPHKKHRDGYLNTDELVVLLDCHKMTLSGFVKRGRIPQPDKVINFAYFWEEQKIREHIKKEFGIGE